MTGCKGGRIPRVPTRLSDTGPVVHGRAAGESRITGDVTGAVRPPVVAVVAGAALAAAAVLVPSLVVSQPVTALVVLAILWGGVVVLTRLSLCLAALVAVTPFEDLLALEVSPQVVKLLGLVVYTAYGLRLVGGVDSRAPRHPATGALVVFVLLLLVSTTVHPNGSDGVATTVRYLSFALLAVILMTVLRVGRLRMLLAALVLASTAAAVVAGGAFLSGAVTRARGPLYDPNDLAFHFAVSVPLALALAAGGRTAVERWGWRACIPVLLAGTALTFSRGALLALGVWLCWATVRGVVRPRALMVGALAVVAVAGGVLLAAPEQVDRAFMEKSRIAGRNIDTRELRWRAAAQMAVDSPVVGQGPSGFRLNYADYDDQSRPDDATDVVAHQMFLEVAAELGLPALVAFVAMLGYAFSAGFSAATRGGPDDRLLASGVVGGLLVTCTASLFLTEQYFLPLWLLVAAAVALELRVRDQEGVA